MSDPDPAADLVVRLRAAGCVFAEDEARLLIEAAGAPDALEALVARRVAGEPLEMIVGWVAFHGRRILLDPGVFVPRRRTELLVDEALRRAVPGGVVVDLCCGSGAVGAAIAEALPGIRLVAADLDAAAVACARRNVEPRGGTVARGDLFAALPPDLRGRIDVLAVNAPYVPTGAIATMPREARDFEPRASLDGGADGLDLHRRVAAEAPEWLAPGGSVLIETSRRQAERTADALAAAGLDVLVVRDDEHDATVAVGAAP